MQQTLVQEEYPVYSLEVDKRETSLQTVTDIINALKQRVEEHKIAKYIATFDHYKHTKELTDGYINSDILAAQNIIFCFGITLPSPQAMAVRPRSIGVVEMEHSFIISFMETPMPVANVAMEEWAKAIKDI